ncbi:OmpA family protein [Roseospira navarrensis]|nr:OmpA family protein [Roseospira navarrensis]
MMRRAGRAWGLWRGMILAGAAAIVPAGPGLADPVPEGPYVGAGGGLNLNDTGDLEIGGRQRELDTDLGFVGLASFGYAFGNGLRAEVEGGHRRNTVDNWGGTGLDGDLSAWHGMVNLLYDIDTGTGFTPFVGAGLGAAFVSIDADNRARGLSADDSDVGLAYQAMVGLGYSVTDSLSLSADYRFFHAVDITADAGSGGVSDSYMNHALVVGLRYAFGVPDQRGRGESLDQMAAPEVPIPPPPAAVPTSYLVFFQFDSADLSPNAASIVDTAARNARDVGRTRIEVTGHTDRVGAESYNLVLSQRRAQTVMERLVSQGIARGDIAVFARGEDEPLIPTPDGVREAQNRRVEIVLM